MPTLLVIWIAKFSGWLSKLLGRGQATSLPGLVAERLQPKILNRLGTQLKDGSILITGTNGKTTATKMISAVLAPDHNLLINRSGANLTRGLVATLIAASDWRGKISSDLAVFEVDEAAFPAAFAALKPKAVVVLNLFRDQLDRYGELDTLAAKLQQALDGTKAEVILNADDPLVAWLGKDLKNTSYFGLDSATVKKLDHDYAADSTACPVCGRALNYSKLFYAHVGIYDCPAKNYVRPKLNVVGNTTKVTLESSKTQVNVGAKKQDLNLELPGLYNTYNALAAVAVGTKLGVSLSESIKRITNMPPAFGRAETIVINNRELKIFLVKNPAGFNQVIQAYRAEPKAQPALILVNDLIADGRDVSWLWDVAFEDLPTKGKVIAGGTRAYDLALRLKYADIESKVEQTQSGAIDKLLEQIPNGGSAIVLPTYTAMLALRRELGKRTYVRGINQ